MGTEAVAVFATRSVKGEVVFKQRKGGVEVNATFTQLAGNHGFHIHKAGDLRGEGCKGACDHYHIGPPQHHGGPPQTRSGQPGETRSGQPGETRSGQPGETRSGQPGETRSGQLGETRSKKGERHTGDLGNVTEGSYRYVLKDVLVEDLFGRSVIIHADEDDYGLGGFDDSLTTGHSGKRIACAIIGRV